MGSRGSAGRMALVALAAGWLAAAVPAFAADEPETSVQSLEEVSAWAKKRYGPAFEQHEFKRGDQEAIVVIGMPTFGLATSEVYLFGRAKSGPFKLLVTMSRFIGIAEAKDTGTGIEVSDVYRSKSPPTPLLFIPWTGIGHGLK